MLEFEIEIIPHPDTFPQSPLFPKTLCVNIVEGSPSLIEIPMSAVISLWASPLKENIAK